MVPSEPFPFCFSPYLLFSCFQVLRPSSLPSCCVCVALHCPFVALRCCAGALVHGVVVPCIYRTFHMKNALSIARSLCLQTQEDKARLSYRERKYWWRGREGQKERKEIHNEEEKRERERQIQGGGMGGRELVQIHSEGPCLCFVSAYVWKIGSGPSPFHFLSLLFEQREREMCEGRNYCLLLLPEAAEQTETSKNTWLERVESEPFRNVTGVSVVRVLRGIE